MSEVWFDNSLANCKKNNRDVIQRNLTNTLANIINFGMTNKLDNNNGDDLKSFIDEQLILLYNSCDGFDFIGNLILDIEYTIDNRKDQDCSKYMKNLNNILKYLNKIELQIRLKYAIVDAVKNILYEVKSDNGNYENLLEDVYTDLQKRFPEGENIKLKIQEEILKEIELYKGLLSAIK